MCPAFKEKYHLLRAFDAGNRDLSLNRCSLETKPIVPAETSTPGLENNCENGFKFLLGDFSSDINAIVLNASVADTVEYTGEQYSDPVNEQEQLLATTPKTVEAYVQTAWTFENTETCVGTYETPQDGKLDDYLQKSQSQGLNAVE